MVATEPSNRPAKTNKIVLPFIHFSIYLTWAHLHTTAGACYQREMKEATPATIRTPKLPISFLSCPISLPEEWSRRCLHISNGLSDNKWYRGCTAADGFVWIPDKDRPETLVFFWLRWSRGYQCTAAYSCLTEYTEWFFNFTFESRLNYFYIVLPLRVQNRNKMGFL